MVGMRNLLVVSAILVVIKTESCVLDHDCRHENCIEGYLRGCEKGLCSCVNYKNCDALAVMSGLAHNLPVGHTYEKCPDNNHIPVMYFIFDACKKIPLQLAQWTKGQKVKDICGVLPHYTAIAHFTGSNYNNLTTANAGIFIGCEKDYFKTEGGTDGPNGQDILKKPAQDDNRGLPYKSSRSSH